MNNIPLLKSLLDYDTAINYRMHMPAHKGTNNYYNDRGFIDNFFNIDITELDSVDSLFTSNGSIKEAQELAAKFYGCKHTFFLVNGATVGIIASILSVVSEGDKILVPRNAHRSIDSGLIMSGAIPVYIIPEFDLDFGITTIYDAIKFEKLLIDHPDIKAVILTHPSFYGLCSDIGLLISIAKKYNKIVIVDEACGSHFKAYDHLPKSSIDLGADIIVHGTHKNLISLTQSAMLHVNSEKIDIYKLRLCLQMLQSSSPSYPLLASLDITRNYLEQYGIMQYKNLYMHIKQFKKDVNTIDGFTILNDELMNNNKIYDFDFTKIILNFNNFLENGQFISELLYKNFGVGCESYSGNNILLTFSLVDDQYKIEGIFDILKKLRLLLTKNKPTCDKYVMPSLPKMVLSPRDAFRYNFEIVPIEQAINKISKEPIYSTIFGMHLVKAGELIEQDIVDYINKIDTPYRFKVIEDAIFRQNNI